MSLSSPLQWKFPFLSGLLSFKLVVLLIYLINNLSEDFGSTLKQHALTCFVINNRHVHCWQLPSCMDDEASQNEVSGIWT